MELMILTARTIGYTGGVPGEASRASSRLSCYATSESLPFDTFPVIWGQWNVNRRWLLAAWGESLGMRRVLYMFRHEPMVQIESSHGFA